MKRQCAALFAFVSWLAACSSPGEVPVMQADAETAITRRTAGETIPDLKGSQCNAPPGFQSNAIHYWLWQLDAG